MPLPPSNQLDRRLTARLVHEFRSHDLLDQALTHRSRGARNNERLEFLGDAILNFLIAESLFSANPDAHEGRLTRLRAHLVRRETLAAVARDLELGEALRLGPGELKSGGRNRDSILADAFEALVGALYLDSGLDACRAIVSRLFAERLEQAPRAVRLKDAKTRLQEALQSRGLPLPDYAVVEVSGVAHDQSFVVACTLDGTDIRVTGAGASRRKAEQDAARKALDAMEGRHGAAGAPGDDGGR